MMRARVPAVVSFGNSSSLKNPCATISRVGPGAVRRIPDRHGDGSGAALSLGTERTGVIEELDLLEPSAVRTRLELAPESRGG